MKEILREGKSTSKIIESFMAENDLKLEDFKFDVVEEGSSGFLNLFGGKPTKVMFTIPDVSDQISKFTKGVIEKLNVQYSELKIVNKDKTYFVEVCGVKDPGFLIGKDARLLDSMQHLINQMINKQERKQIKLRIDVDGYRQRRKDALMEKISAIAEKVKQRDKSITLEPLPASNRRLVHQFIEKDKDLRTMTIGDGEYKRVVILPSSGNNDRSRRPRAGAPRSGAPRTGAPRTGSPKTSGTRNKPTRSTKPRPEQNEATETGEKQSKPERNNRPNRANNSNRTERAPRSPRKPRPQRSESSRSENSAAK